MRIFYTADHCDHQPKSEQYDGIASPYPEVSARVDAILAGLQQHNFGTIHTPRKYPLEHIHQIHSQPYVSFLRRRCRDITRGEQVQPSYFISDTYAPLTSGTYHASRRAVDAALAGADAILRGEQVAYSLCRPPGHHAGHQSTGGYCYFNNAAIAANHLSSHGRVAILDIDFHHGNGTQDAFYTRADVFYVSLHADPSINYPYIRGFATETGEADGVGCNLNIVVSKNATVTEYIAGLEKALAKIQDFAPDYLVVSAGFDTFIDDPIGGLRLNADDYTEIAEHIVALRTPSLIVQEGGYNTELLGELVVNFLQPFNRWSSR